MNGSKIYCSEIENRREIIEFLYGQEIEWWHRNVYRTGGTKEENIETTIATLKEGHKFFAIFCDYEIAGYFAIGEDEILPILNGFHVAKKYRSRIFFAIYWDIIKSMFRNEIYCGLCVNNKRAIAHIQKQGFIKFAEREDNGIDYLIFKYN